MIIQARGLSKLYGDKFALQPLNFDVQQGDILGLIGANGGGKTTLLRMMAGVLPASEGTLQVLGYTLPKNAKMVRANNGYMAQNLALYDELTVAENLRFRASIYGLPKPKQAVENTIARFGLSKYTATRAGKLSGGWGRLIQLAASVIHQPSLLLLDEPTAGLDAAARQQVWQYIYELSVAGATVVVSTHDLGEAIRCSNTLFLAGGHLLAKGAPADIIREADCSAYTIERDKLDIVSRELAQLSGFYSATRENDSVRLVVPADVVEGLFKILRRKGVPKSQVSTTLTDVSAYLLHQAALSGGQGEA